jgi:hypothetical protein
MAASKICTICHINLTSSSRFKNFYAESYERILMERYVFVFEDRGYLCCSCLKRLQTIENKCVELINKYRKTKIEENSVMCTPDNVTTKKRVRETPILDSEKAVSPAVKKPAVKKSRRTLFDADHDSTASLGNDNDIV